MNITEWTAQNIKRLRESRKLTLEGAAKATGVSRSMLAQIEKGETNPTIGVLWKIANGFKVSFTSLVECPREATALVRAERITPLQEDGGKYLNYPLFPFEEERQFELYRIVILPGGELQAQPHIAGTEEYVTVFAGRAEITTDGQTFVLCEGDALRFHADTAHSYRNCGEETVQMSMLIYYSQKK